MKSYCSLIPVSLYSCMFAVVFCILKHYSIPFGCCNGAEGQTKLSPTIHNCSNLLFPPLKKPSTIIRFQTHLKGNKSLLETPTFRFGPPGDPLLRIVLRRIPPMSVPAAKCQHGPPDLHCGLGHCCMWDDFWGLVRVVVWGAVGRVGYSMELIPRFFPIPQRPTSEAQSKAQKPGTPSPADKKNQQIMIFDDF